jgi:hypothetical protein
VFAEAAAQAGVQVGTSALNLVNLVWLGVTSAMNAGVTFACVLTTTLKVLDDMGVLSTSVSRQRRNARRRAKRKGTRGRRSKHSPHGSDPTQVSEEAFAQARQRMPLGFWMALLMILAREFQKQHSEQLHFRGFRLLAMDGTTLTLPKSNALLTHYGRPKNAARKNAAPQARMVMLTLPGTRIPIAYEVTPLADTELTVSRRLLQHLRVNDLLLMDRGFFSYGLFWQIQSQGAYFGTRLKSDVRYRKLQKLGPKDWLVEWTPKDSRGQWKDLPRSIQLRVIHYQFPGFRASAIVTNVLSPQRLSREDWIRMALTCDDNGKWTPGLYHRRWEIETTYFELKVVLKTESLRSRTPASIEYEIAGRVVYYLLVRWLIVEAAKKHGLDPLRISFTNAVREVEQMRPILIASDPHRIASILLPRLLERIASHLVPRRPGRRFARPNDAKSKHRTRRRKRKSAKTNCRVNSSRHNTQRRQRCQA